MKPLNDYVLVRKCVNDHIRSGDGEVLIYLTDHSHEQTNWAEILDCGPKCSATMKAMAKEGDWLLQCPENANGMHFIGEDCWLIRESLFDRKELAGIAVKHEPKAVA